MTKATVTLTFCNKDRAHCPIGYERCEEISITRQIVVGGKNKYFINGKIQQNKQVQDLFCSVQLNVNNPNFLIMQDHITKVLSMKPPEILSMIEESAGASMCENVREEAVALIKVKNAKIMEFDIKINGIEPELNKLSVDRDLYKEYYDIIQQIDFLTRIHYSYEYIGDQEKIKKKDLEIAALEEEIRSFNDTTKSNEAEVLAIDDKIQEIQETMNNVGILIKYFLFLIKRFQFF